MQGSSYKYFLAISLVFGLIYIFIIPPFQAPDEDSHFFRTYEIASPHKTENVDPNNRLGGYLPASLFEYSDQFRYLRFNYEGKITKDQLLQFNEKKLDKVNIKFTDFSNTAMYFPTAYPLQSIFCKVGVWLNWSPSSLLYLLRIASLLTWLILMFFAFKLFESTNQLFLFICLLPSILVLHTSITADVISNALSFLLFAFVFKLRRQEAKVSMIQIIYFALMILIICINKIVYFPLILLWFFLPFGKFDSSLKYYGSFSIISASCILVTLMWSLKVNDAYITYEEYDPLYRHDQQIKPNANPEKQMEYIMNNPISFTATVIKSYASIVPASIAHLTGKFGWEKNYMSTYWIIILSFFLLVLLNNNNPTLSIKDRLLFVGIIISSLFILAIVMFGLYSEIGNDYIHNLGGKYLIPLFPLLAFVFSNKYIPGEPKEKHLFLIIIFAHLSMLIKILSRYYY